MNAQSELRTLRTCLLQCLTEGGASDKGKAKTTPGGPAPGGPAPGDIKRPSVEPESERKKEAQRVVQLPPRQTPAGVVVPSIATMNVADIHPAAAAAVGAEPEVRVHMHMRADPSWSARKKAKKEPPPTPTTESDYEDKLLQLCKLIAGQPLFHGKTERLWDQKGAEAWRAKSPPHQPRTLDRKTFEKEYSHFLTAEGFAVVVRGATLILNAPAKRYGQFTLVDLLDTPLFWNDFVGLATVQRSQTEQEMYAANGRYFSGRAYEVTYRAIQNTSEQHRRAFQLAVKIDGKWTLGSAGRF